MHRPWPRRNPLLANDLGGRVGEGPTRGVEETVKAEGVREGGKAEIGKLEVAIAVEEEFLRFHVVVGDALGMAEIEGEDELLEIMAGGRLWEAAAMGEAREELVATGVLHDEVDLGARGHHHVEPEDVGVVGEATYGRDFAEDERAAPVE